MDRGGKEEAIAAEPRAYSSPRISPEGSQVALGVSDQERDIWIWDFARETLVTTCIRAGQRMVGMWHSVLPATEL